MSVKLSYKNHELLVILTSDTYKDKRILLSSESQSLIDSFQKCLNINFDRVKANQMICTSHYNMAFRIRYLTCKGKKKREKISDWADYPLGSLVFMFDSLPDGDSVKHHLFVDKYRKFEHLWFHSCIITLICVVNVVSVIINHMRSSINVGSFLVDRSNRWQLFYLSQMDTDFEPNRRNQCTSTTNQPNVNETQNIIWSAEIALVITGCEVRFESCLLVLPWRTVTSNSEI